MGPGDIGRTQDYESGSVLHGDGSIRVFDSGAARRRRLRRRGLAEMEAVWPFATMAVVGRLPARGGSSPCIRARGREEDECNPVCDAAGGGVVQVSCPGMRFAGLSAVQWRKRGVLFMPARLLESVR